jgi:hypothetical protein
MPARASRSALGRLERTSKTGAASDRYKKIRNDAAASDRPMVEMRLESRKKTPSRIVMFPVSGFRFLTGFRRSRFCLRFPVAVSGCTHGRCSEQHRPCDTQSI